MLHDESNVKDEPKDRIRVVGEQYKLEIAVVQSKKGAAVFLVPACVTPLYIPRKNLENIPDGLIPENKLHDPEQLQTVTERVESINAILEAGMPITVLCVDRDRKKADQKPGTVDNANVTALEKKYANLKIVTISQEQYDQFKGVVCAASYCYGDEHTLIGINAVQINTPNTPNPWDVLKDEAVKPAIAKLDELLHALGLPPLEDMAEEKKAVASAISDAKLATTLGLFTESANESTQKQPMPSSNTYRP